MNPAGSCLRPGATLKLTINRGPATLDLFPPCT